MNLRKTFAIVAFGACVTIGAVLLAQQGQVQPRQPAQPAQIQQPAAQPAQAGQRPVWMTTDQHVASSLAIGNHVEVALAEFAHERTDDEDVKEFAKMLIDDHKAFLKKLERWTPQAANDDFLTQDGGEGRDDADDAASRTGAGQAQPRAGFQRTAGARGAAGSQPVNITQLDREIGHECFNTFKQLLSSKEGDEFNHCFVGGQFMMHHVLQDQLTVFQRHTSDELNAVLSDASSTIDEHMTKAEELMKKWEPSSGRVAKEEKEAERK